MSDHLVPPAGVTLLDDRSAQEALRSSGIAALPVPPHVVGDAVPATCAAYARLLPRLGVVTAGTTDVAWRQWADLLPDDLAPGAVAAALRGAVRAAAAAGQQVLPYVGELDPATRRSLLDLLVPLSEEAYGHVGGVGAAWADGRVYRGPTPIVATLGTPARVAPAVLWAATGAWCVAAPQDALATYVGGPATLLHALLDHPDIEARAVTPADPLDDGATIAT